MDDYLQQSHAEFVTDKAVRDTATALKRYRDLIRDMRRALVEWVATGRVSKYSADIISRADEILGEE